MGLTSSLMRSGLLNTNSVDISDMQGYDKDKIATWCQSFTCAPRSVTKNGVIVHVGQFGLSICPYCHSIQHLTSDTVTKRGAERLIRELELRNERRKKGCYGDSKRD